MSGSYYNENDPNAAEWLRELIKAGAIAPGEVDGRDIRDIRPSELTGFRQHHFFAGVGGWAEALRLAGWPDDQPVWTGSCPCQPFSAAGKGVGFADERHLWPAWFHLIEERRPDDIFGEQVASPAGLEWFDLVRSDLEGAGYACGPADLCAAGIGAPHIRQRLWWMAHTDGWDARAKRLQRGWKQRQLKANGRALWLADAEIERLNRSGLAGASYAKEIEGPRRVGSEDIREVGELGNAGGERSRRDAGALPGEEGSAHGQMRYLADQLESAGAVGRFWSGADWIYCTDGKYRPVEPGTFPLAHGLPARVGRLRGYGNAIVPEVAAEIIRAALS